MKALTLGKYEAAGNDFLVLVDPATDLGDPRLLARALCDRHRGIGADGLLVLRAAVSGGPIAMTLFNADGSSAETSGNGLRCAILAAHHAGLAQSEQVDVLTEAGLAHGELLEMIGPGAARLRVAMGIVSVAAKASSPIEGALAFVVLVGNPHLVLLADSFAGVDLAAIGPQLSNAVPLGQNVELISPGALPDELVLQVFERGVGITIACGTGSCAGAAAARFSGMVGDRVAVDNPGGRLVVELSGEPASPRAHLSGPVRRVATVSIETADLGLSGESLSA